jgi:hypothetical protein
MPIGQLHTSPVTWRKRIQEKSAVTLGKVMLPREVYVTFWLSSEISAGVHRACFSCNVESKEIE